jgi:type III pantothenate kinase
MAEFGVRLRAQWRDEPPDVVHAHFWMSAVAALAAAGPLGIPVVHTFHALGTVKRRHQGDRDTSPPERLGIEREIAERVDRIVATCTDEVFELVRMGADPHRVTVVPCGVDLGLFGGDGPAEPRTEGRHRLVSASRLVERKGLGEMVERARRAARRGAAHRRRPAGRRARGRARRPVVSGRSRPSSGWATAWCCAGAFERTDMPALLRSADVVVCAPWYEPFGIVPLEAMACGVPVVATAVGGQIDSVVHGETGVHVPPRDPAALALALRELLDDPERRAALGANGRERARQRYAFDRIAAATRDVYADLAGGFRRDAASPAPTRVAPHEHPHATRRPGASGHLAALRAPLAALDGELARPRALGHAARRPCSSAAGALLAAGNGGSASQAQHLTSELVGRYRDERVPLSAIALCTEGPAVTAIGNDYGVEEMFARQVRAHGRPGDVLVALSTSGRSPNVLAAVEAARAGGMTTWALAGRPGTPLALACDDALCVDSAHTATIQEVHLITIHLLCEAVDASLEGAW